MAISKSANTYNRLNWEESEFPIICQTCLGDNPYLRMMKEKHGDECKICTRPFTIFRWCPGAKMRFKRTEICQTCCKMKNICQTCLLDLEYGLPVQVRDTAIGAKDDIPKAVVNRDYYIQNQEKALGSSKDGNPSLALLGEKASQPNDMLMKLARTTPYYRRNLPHICSFWVKGECKRGEECPYRHEKPTDPDDPLAHQNIKDRYFGTNDPVAEKLLNRAKTLPKLEIPEDKTITTLYIGGINESVLESDLRDVFYQFGEIRNISLVPKQQCAFLQFAHRSSAEQASQALFGKLIVKGVRLNVRWGKPQSNRDYTNIPGLQAFAKYDPVPGLPEFAMPTEPPAQASTSSDDGAPPAKKAAPNPSGTYISPVMAAGAPPSDFFNLGAQQLSSGAVAGSSSSTDDQSMRPGPPRAYYPSQDPRMLGSNNL